MSSVVQSLVQYVWSVQTSIMTCWLFKAMFIYCDVAYFSILLTFKLNLKRTCVIVQHNTRDSER